MTSESVVVFFVAKRGLWKFRFSFLMLVQICIRTYIYWKIYSYLFSPPLVLILLRFLQILLSSFTFSTINLFFSLINWRLHLMIPTGLWNTLHLPQFVKKKLYYIFFFFYQFLKCNIRWWAIRFSLNKCNILLVSN